MQLNKEEYKNFKQIVNIFYNEEIEGINEDKEKIKKEGTIKIEPRIFYDKFSGDMKIEFKIGNKKMYKIKNLSEFYTRMLNKEFYRYGEKLQFIHTEEAFENNSRQLLEFVMKYAEVIKYANSNSNSNYKYYGKALSETSIIVGNSAIDDLFDVLKGRKIIFQKDCNTEEIEFTEEQPEIEFELKKTENKDYIILDYFEKELNHTEREYFKRLWKKLSNEYNKTIVIFTNDIRVIWDIVEEWIIVDKYQVINTIPKSNYDLFIDNLNKPEIFKLIDLIKTKGIPIENYQDPKELLKAIYRIKENSWNI